MSCTTSTADFDEDGVKILLLGEAEEINEGLSAIDREYRLMLSGWIRDRFPSISSDDLGEIWGDTLLALFKMVEAGTFDPDQPLEPLLRTVIKRRAVSRIRRKKPKEEQLEVVAQDLSGTLTGAAWSALTSSDRVRIQQAIRRAIATLPPKQGVVMDVWVNEYPDSISMEFLRAEVSKVTSEEETLFAVKRALQEARGKVRDWLQERGYEDLVN